MTEDLFSVTLAPICFALLSDKVREKTAALTKLHSILPHSIKQKDFTSDTAEKVCKSFLDWLQAEIRISKRTANNSAIISTMKEVKWIISLFDSNFPRINLSRIVLELIDRLTDVLLQKCSFTEVLYILNHHILCKSQYLNEFRNSKLISRFNRLLTVLTDQIKISESPETFIKSLGFLAISLPNSLKLEPFTYEMLHESFIWYFNNNTTTKNESSLTSLLSAINSLLLDYFEHSTKYSLEYFNHILPLIRCKNNPILFNKTLQYFLQVKDRLSSDQRQQLALQLQKELDDPQNCPLYSVDPVNFCKQIVEQNYLIFSDFSRKMFLELCADVLDNYENNVPLLLYMTLTGVSLDSITIPYLDHKKIKNSFDWTSLLQFHMVKNKVCSIGNGSKNTNWYKLWYTTENPTKFSALKIDELDEFVERSLKSNVVLDFLAFDALSSYFNFRFKNIWWTSSAKETFELFLDCLLLNDNYNFILDYSFYKCLLSPLDLELKYSTEIEDPKALDCFLFLKRLEKLHLKTDDLFKDYERKDTVTFKEHPLVLSDFYVESLQNFLCKLLDSSDSFSFLKFLVSLFDQKSVSEFNFFDEQIDSFKIYLINLFGKLIVEKVEITNLLSQLIPILQNSEPTADSSDFDEDFCTRNSKFEVNLITAEVFKTGESKTNLLTSLAEILLKNYSKYLTNPTTEQEQILNDWRLFMQEVGSHCAFNAVNSNRYSVYNTDNCHINYNISNVADALKEVVPYFDFPLNLNHCISFEVCHLLPNCRLIEKQISTPEQWIPFFYLLLKSQKSSRELILEWLFTLCSTSNTSNCSGILLKFIKENVNSDLIQDLLKIWIESGKAIQKFPFYLTEIPAHEFVLKSPHFPLILSKNQTIGDLLCQFVSTDKISQIISENLSYIVASCLLEEASAKLSNRRPVDFSFCKTPAITSIKFLKLISVLLLHGQFYPWSVLVSALQSLAKMFKLSAATDFSEIFNPVHSVLILREIAPFVHDFEFLERLFKNVPILSYHPQLLKLTLKLLIGKRPAYELESYKAFKASHDHVHSDNFSFPVDCDLITFILIYGHSKLFSIDEFSIGIFELVYKLLNLAHVNGSRIFPLESFENVEKDDLKMLLLPIGSKVLCFDPAVTATVTPAATANNSNSTYAATIEQFMEIKWMNCNSLNLLKSLALFLISQNKNENNNFNISNLISSTILKEKDYKFLELILPLLFDSFNQNFVSFSLYPQIIQKLIEGLEQAEQGENTNLKAEILKLLLLIIEKTPIGSNFVDTLLRRFAFNPKIFKLLQSSSKQNSLYFFFLLRESPKMAHVELNLEEFGDLLTQNGEEEYFKIVKKRLSKFETDSYCDIINDRHSNDNYNHDSYSNDSYNSHSPDDSYSNNCSWLDKKWFDKKDFKPKNLCLLNFKKQAENFKNLNQLLSTGNSSNLPDLEIVKILENCLKNKKSPNFKEIIKFASDETEPLNFNGVALLSLISPKMEQLTKHLLVDMTSKIYWKRGEMELALETAKGALSLFPPVLSDESKGLLLSRIGEWAAASKLERPSHILSQYLEKAMNLCENTSNFSPASLAQIHIKVARFVDDQYQQIKESEDFKSRAKLLEESRAALNAARAAASANTQDRRQLEISISTLRSQYDLDMNEYSERLRSLNAFLLKSVQNYIAALNFGTCNLSESEQMAAVSRLCALWFSNSDFSEINELINNSMTTSGKRTLPLQLFLPLIYQLAARASYDPSTVNPNHFQRTLIRLLVQLTLHHPFDCIYQLLALRSGNSDDPNSTSNTSSKRRKLLDPQDHNVQKTETDLRAAAASIIIDQTRKIPELSVSIPAVEVLVDAYIELANAPPPQQVKSSVVIDFPANLKIKKLLYPLPTDSPLRKVPIPTGPSDGEKFAGFIDGYKVLCGINLPKQLEAVSSNGTRHAQLVKGKDDVRQDAVMEQVFLRVNKLLSSSEETRNRKLRMRTYRVIPLRPLVGLLEWVSDSIPLATFLNEAHERLRPGDLHPSKCRDLIRFEAERPGSTIQSKLNVLLKEVGQRFRPVLRYFFFEHFSMNNWWTAKQAYTASMATASIVGWIVGLGDRHGMNILLDKRTGEVVHIDLNMIFEAGRTLRIPERVPFRLTPDCVDGLGPEGIGLEGPFKNHAISTLKVLRKEKSLLMMIMEVFKYDPLQKWTGIAKAIENKTSPATFTGTSTSSSDLITKEADRALMRIKEKLEGREEGVVLSEAGHVAFLIQTAMDPELLCQMYFGWQAYL